MQVEVLLKIWELEYLYIISFSTGDWSQTKDEIKFNGIVGKNHYLHEMVPI